MKNYKELLNDVTTFILDVDGVLTDGRLLISESGELLRTMNARDGYAIKTALNNGYKVCIITGGRNDGVKSRLMGLGVEDVFLNASDKMVQMREYVAKHNLTPEEILYMGDDMPDLPALEYAGVATCPQDAIQEVKSICNYISHRNGGDSCVRDVIEQVMKVQGKWNATQAVQAVSS
ncbi:3-deoxy-D-manno-octulosonate 8-phosphate phosphatase [Nonlabens sp. MIC269]|uniref:KdsC family phosphatase n=1 Tax=Nonlabens TaxID=363408 RepID=UPI000720DADD|nr:HAD hydrolase family protein [Nonlabens sp. MIC269]ALM20119.1 3-deoxy-D-manno-octulosonate 8-phosphate phosphatase [Nonlabens sp. MIC269]MEE2802739.1 HAD hydrolase family protein [Bacteroidota bacterium]